MRAELQNLPYLKCAFCWKNRATTKITDAETLQEVNICLKCYNSIWCLNTDNKEEAK